MREFAEPEVNHVIPIESMRSFRHSSLKRHILRHRASARVRMIAELQTNIAMIGTGASRKQPTRGDG
jgi:hypothetical protein